MKNLRQQSEYKDIYDWLLAVCTPEIVERLDGTLGDHEADRVLASFLTDVHSDGHIEIYRGYTISKNPEINSFDELAEETWQLGTRYSSTHCWETEIYSSLDEVLVEVDNIKTDCPEITISLFRGDTPIDTVEIEYAVGCRETGDIIDTFPEIDQAKKALDDYEKADTDEGIFKAKFYAYWAVPDTSTI